MSRVKMDEWRSESRLSQHLSDSCKPLHLLNSRLFHQLNSRWVYVSSWYRLEMLEMFNQRVLVVSWYSQVSPKRIVLETWILQFVATNLYFRQNFQKLINCIQNHGKSFFIILFYLGNPDKVRERHNEKGSNFLFSFVIGSLVLY